MNFKHFVGFFAVILFTIPTTIGQSLRINEVSQGATGNKEYIELIVINNTTVSCNQAVPCLDLRQWILDDNNGRFSTSSSGTGIAPGAIRFSNSPFWQCIPTGTLILIYNDAETYTGFPADDFSTSDGNCRLVLPISSNYFEKHSTLPSSTSMNYPTTGWTAGGDWNTIGMANGGDSFQIYAPTNTTVPVHSISWGNNNVNTQIYFSGNAGSKVHVFTAAVSNDYLNQANWSELCCGVVSCGGVDDQTPGIANNPANANLLQSYNPTCGAPMTLVETVSTESCFNMCDATGSISVNGGTAPYTYLWSNGATTVTTTSLCSGNQSVTVTDANGCTQTIQFNVVAGQQIALPTSPTQTICEGQTITLSTFLPINTPYTVFWNQGVGFGNGITVVPTQSTTYIGDIAVGNGCIIKDTIDVIVIKKPFVDFTISTSGICLPTLVKAQVTSDPTMNYEWYFNNDTLTGNQFQVTLTSSGCRNITLVGSHLNSTCSGTKTIINAVCLAPEPKADFYTSPGYISESQNQVQFSNISTNASSYHWNFGDFTGSSSEIHPIHVYQSINPTGYWVRLIAFNDMGCTDTTLRILPAKIDFTYFIPNTFTPNGDEFNNTFGVHSAQADLLNNFSFYIYDRWGMPLFESHDISVFWDGTYNGTICQDGTYTWKLEYGYVEFDKRTINTGHFTLLR